MINTRNDNYFCCRSRLLGDKLVRLLSAPMHTTRKINMQRVNTLRAREQKLMGPLHSASAARAIAK